MNDKNVIGWRRNYSSSLVPVTNYVLSLGDFVGKDERVTLFLEKLFGLGVRGLDLYEIAYARKGEHSNYLINVDKPVLFVYPPVESVEDSPTEWYNRNRMVITELERRYPGLFVFDGGVVGGLRRHPRRSVRRRRSRRSGLRRVCYRKSKKCIRRRRR
jgi:hypothetical protein